MTATSTIGNEDTTGRVRSSGSVNSISVGVNGITVKGRTKTYGTYQEMLSDKSPGKFAYVLDASGDKTVGSGFAYYVWEEGIWRKLFEQEVMDVETSGHTHTNMEVLDRFGITARKPTFDKQILAFKYELDREIAKLRAESTHPSQFRYEFIDEDIELFPLDEKTYIVRNAKLTATLPNGKDMWDEVCYRLVIDEAAAEKGGVIVPYNGESINGGSVFHLDQAMDVRIIYDRKNKDWVTIGTFM